MVLIFGYTMNIKACLGKGIILIVISLLLFSFKASYFELDQKDRTKIYSEIEKAFSTETYKLNTIDDTFFSILEQDSIMGYLAITDAPSKFHRFDYYVLFDSKADVLKVEILHYRENYGAEICSKRWLRKFINIDTENIASYHRKIDAISGATISVNSLKKNLLRTCKELKLKL